MSSENPFVVTPPPPTSVVEVPEILDIIIDHLYSDKTTLNACSLVCRSWTRSATYHLFADITIDTSRLSLLGDYLAQIPTKDENAFQHVQTLRVEDHHLPFDVMRFYTVLTWMPSLHKLVLHATRYSLQNPGTPPDEHVMDKISLTHVEISYESQLNNLRNTVRPVIKFLISLKHLQSLVLDTRQPHDRALNGYERSLIDRRRIPDLAVHKDSSLRLRSLDIKHCYAPWGEAHILSPSC